MKPTKKVFYVNVNGKPIVHKQHIGRRERLKSQFYKHIRVDAPTSKTITLINILQRLYGI